MGNSHQINEEVLAQLGMKVVESGTKKEGSVSSNLPAVPDTFAVARRMRAEGIDGACKLDHTRNRAMATSRMRERLVMREDGETPLFVSIMFEPSVVKDQKGKPIDIKVSAMVEIDGESRRAVPMISIGIDYLVLDQTSRVLRSNGAFQCLVFRPKQAGGDYKLYPLGLVDPSTISMYNRIAKASGQWGEITPIENNLSRSGTKVMEHEMNGLVRHQYKNGDKESRVGYHFGKRLILSVNSNQPTPEVVDGKRLYTGATHLFRYEEHENFVVLTWLCKKGDVNVDLRVPLSDVKAYEMDWFKVLGLTPLTANLRTFESNARDLINQKYDHRNPLYRAGIQSGLILETDPRAVAIPHMTELAKKAVQKVTEELNAQFAEVTRKLSLAPSRPSIEALLQGRRLEHVLRIIKEDDPAAVWIEKNIAGEFNRTSPFHKAVRMWLLHVQAKVEGYRDPPKEDTKPEAKADPVAPVKEKEKPAPKRKPRATAKAKPGTNGAGKPAVPRVSKPRKPKPAPASN